MSKRSLSIRQEIAAPEHCTFAIFAGQEGQLRLKLEQGWTISSTACEFITPSNDAMQSHGKVRWVFLLERA